MFSFYLHRTRPVITKTGHQQPVKIHSKLAKVTPVYGTLVIQNSSILGILLYISNLKFNNRVQINNKDVSLEYLCRQLLSADIL